MNRRKISGVLRILACLTTVLPGALVSRAQIAPKARIYTIGRPGIAINTFIMPAGKTTIPDNQIQLDASASTDEGGGTINSWTWEIAASDDPQNPPAFSNNNAVKTAVNGLKVGHYFIKLTLRDDKAHIADETIPITVRSPLPSDTATIQFVGNANIQPSLTGGSTIPANSGVGVIYKETLSEAYKWLYSIEMQVAVNIASTVDTVKAQYDDKGQIINRSDFGNSLLLPLNSGQAFSFCARMYFTQYDRYRGRILDADGYPLAWLGVISGLYLNAEGSNRNWSNDTTSIKASQLSLQLGFFHEFIKPANRANYSITLGLGYSGRWLAGDITEHVYDDLRMRLTGSPRRAFGGAEVIVGLRLKDIKAEFHIPFLSTKNPIPGLSGTQPSTLLGFTGGFSLQL